MDRGEEKKRKVACKFFFEKSKGREGIQKDEE